jgi:hypothetical protein
LKDQLPVAPLPMVKGASYIFAGIMSPVPSANILIDPASPLFVIAISSCPEQDTQPSDVVRFHAALDNFGITPI